MTRTTRPLLAGMWLTSLVGFALDLVLEPSLPPPLRAYISAEVERPLDWTDVALTLLVVTATGLTVYGSVQLYRLRREGRGLLAAGFVLGLLVVLASSPAVYNPWAATLNAASYLFGGALLGWLYLPPRSAADLVP